MELFSWKPEFSVSNPTIDSQHKGLIDNINKLFEAMRTGKAENEINGILKSLQKYTITHFRHEESLMKQKEYPELTVHQAEHVRFTEQINSLIAEVESGKKTVSIELLKFLKEWLLNHILKVDMRYSSHI